MNSFFFFSTLLLSSPFVCDDEDVKWWFFISLSKQRISDDVCTEQNVRLNAVNTRKCACFKHEFSCVILRERKVLVSSSYLLTLFVSVVFVALKVALLLCGKNSRNPLLRV